MNEVFPLSACLMQTSLVNLHAWYMGSLWTLLPPHKTRRICTNPTDADHPAPLLLVTARICCPKSYLHVVLVHGSAKVKILEERYRN